MRKLLRDTTGATAIEYSVIAAVVSVAAVGAFLALGQGVNTRFQTVETAYQKSK